MNRMTGHAPVNKVYRIARTIASSGVKVTRCKYATLAKMARAAGDLPIDETKGLNTRLKSLVKWDLVRYSSGRRCYELTAKGWGLLVKTEETWNLRQE